MVKPEKENGKADTPPALQEIQQPELFKKEKTPVNPKNVVHHVAVDAKNACNSGQSKVKKSRAKENKELPLSSPEGRRKKDGGFCFSTDTGIRLQYDDTQLSGTDGYTQKTGDYRSRRGECHTQAIGLWKERNTGMATDCQYLLE